MKRKRTRWPQNSDTPTMVMPMLCALLLTAETVFSQKNLVPNGGFDSVEVCPGDAAQLKLAYSWRNGVFTPDLFHECSANPYFQTPNPYGCNYLPPKNGGGYIGLYVYFSREMAEVTLSRALEKGKKYYARFFVAPDENCVGGWEKSFTDAIAMGVNDAGNANSNFELVAETSGTILNDTANWTEVSGCFVAKGKENTLRVGNFLSDAETIVEPPDDPFGFNYMFVDDVFLGTFDPFPDTVLLCEGMPTALDATFLESEYQWNTGATEPVLIVGDTGRYAVQATIDGCVFRDTVRVVSLPPTNSTTLNDTTLCDNESLVFAAPIPGEYLWSNGSTAPQIVVKKPGEYSVTVTNECGEFHFSQKVEAENCRCRVFVPNIFSPNDDGYNDVLEISIGCEHDFTVEQFEIFDRWGGQVFASNSYPLATWDGKTKGQKTLPGVYVWHLTYSLNRNGTARKIVEQGDVTLVR